MDVDSGWLNGDFKYSGELLSFGGTLYLKTILELYSSLHGLLQSVHSLLPCLIQILPCRVHLAHRALCQRHKHF